MLTRGYKFPEFWPFHGKVLRPINKTILIPPLIGMIVFGCIARNFFGPYMDNYNMEWGAYIRMGALSVILL